MFKRHCRDVRCPVLAIDLFFFAADLQDTLCTFQILLSLFPSSATNFDYSSSLGQFCLAVAVVTNQTCSGDGMNKHYLLIHTVSDEAFIFGSFFTKATLKF